MTDDEQPKRVPDWYRKYQTQAEQQDAAARKLIAELGKDTLRQIYRPDKRLD